MQYALVKLIGLNLGHLALVMRRELAQGVADVEHRRCVMRRFGYMYYLMRLLEEVCKVRFHSPHAPLNRVWSKRSFSSFNA